MISRKDFLDETLDKIEDLPPPLSSKSPVKKLINHKIHHSRNLSIVNEDNKLNSV